MSGAEILKRILDAHDFGVGGGSASALCGGMAAGLLAMVANLSMKQDFGLSREELLGIAKEGEELSKTLLKGAKEDAEAYRCITDAFALPKETEAEKARRSAAIRQGFQIAATVPKDNAWRSRRVQELCKMLQGRSNPACGTDLATACYLADIAVLGCVLNVETNLGSMKDEKIKFRLQKDADTLRTHIKWLKMEGEGSAAHENTNVCT